MDHLTGDLDCRFARDEDDPAPIPLLHSGKIVARQANPAHDVGLEEAQPVGVGNLLEWFGLEDPQVVDQDVHVRDLPDQPGRSIGRGQIGRDAQHVRRACSGRTPQPLHRCPDTLRTAAVNDDRCPFAHQPGYLLGEPDRGGIGPVEVLDHDEACLARQQLEVRAEYFVAARGALQYLEQAKVADVGGDVTERAERPRGCQRVAGPDKDRHTAISCISRHQAGESALSDTCLAADEHEPTVTLRCRCQPFGDVSDGVRPFEKLGIHSPATSSGRHARLGPSVRLRVKMNG